MSIKVFKLKNLPLFPLIPLVPLALLGSSLGAAIVALLRVRRLEHRLADRLG